ncbi:hypothetical protein LPJ68_002902 [Coemansia sp. RSA 1086]|nr:hypothetical protein LPJ68_002902 [Coemansia sp. RSA 1086]
MQNTQVVVEVQSSSDVEKHSVATLELGSANSDVYRDQSASPQDLQQSPEDTMRTPPPNSRSRLQKQHNLSPSKVYGNRIEVNGDFGTVARGNGVVLDKSLLCKALFDAGRTAICVCLPRRFGKTFNLSVLEEFFNIPHGEDAAAVNGIIDIEVARCSRLKLFEGSLLMENHPEFFEENFCKFPVIRISMKNVKATSLASFNMGLFESIAEAAEQWLSRQVDVDWGANSIWNDLKESYRDMTKQLDSLDGWEYKGRLAIRIYKLLQSTLSGVFRCKCIVLLDEYDTPLANTYGKSWKDNAQLNYLNLINVIFKDNLKLRTGVLVGVHYIKLGDLSSGANNINALPLTVMEERKRVIEETNGAKLKYFGELFAFTKPEVEALVSSVHQKYAATRLYSTTAIVAKAVEWYDGYCFGRCCGKFNPHAVLMFLQELCSESLDDAARNFWEMTGNQHMVESIVLNNRINILVLATELLRGYQADNLGLVKLANVWKQPNNWNAEWPIIKIYLDNNYMFNTTGPMSISKLVTLFIYTGYLTIKPGGHIAIPNGEMCRMWERLFQLSSNGECDPEQRKDQLGQLHSELYAGKIESLLTEIREIMDPMPNSINGHDEHAYGNIFRTFLFMKFRHYDGGGSEQHVRFLSELETGIGKTDLIVTFPTTQEHSDELTIIIEFKKIYKNEFTSTDYPLKRAIDGLEQIIEKGYARTQRRPWKKSKRRLDIGIAMGCGKVAMCQRLWKSLGKRLSATDRGINSSLYPKKKADETIAEYNQRVVEADKTVWHDGLGWETMPLDTSFYCN